MLMKREKLFSEFAPVSTQEWMEAITKDLKGADFNKKLVWRTAEGFSVEPFYRADNLEGLDFLNEKPGEFPFVRGGKTENNDWEVRQDFRI
ncbi:MAG: methylmalonyl-CoA mutase small subunit, partial [Bacteroidales bacterium]|nr:methylmalonyl-CoA mutase small subunit [Bacteroidales bacterium]